MPATLIPALESLSALPRQAADEVELFPSFKGGKSSRTRHCVSTHKPLASDLHPMTVGSHASLLHDSTQPAHVGESNMITSVLICLRYRMVWC